MACIAKICTASAAALAMGACDGTIHRTSKLGDVSVLSVDARQRIIVTGTREELRTFNEDGRTVQRYVSYPVTCAEPSPDAIVAQAVALAGAADTGEVGGNIAASLSENAGSIGLRTQSIQLLRDGYYRICEAYLNRAIDPDAYKKVIDAIDHFMITLVAIEAVTGVVVAPAIAVGANGQVTLGEDGKPATSTQATQAILRGIEAKGTTLTDAQTRAVVEIVRLFYSK